jgi:hypothetical protein
MWWELTAHDETFERYSIIDFFSIAESIFGPHSVLVQGTIRYRLSNEWKYKIVVTRATLKCQEKQGLRHVK